MTTTILPQLPAPAASSDNTLATVELVEQAREYADAAQAHNTKRAYAADWRDFSGFCQAHDAPALPASPQTVALYVSGMADRVAVATIRRRLASIASRHRECGYETPCGHEIVKRIVRGICRTKGVAPKRKDALTIAALKEALLAVQGDDLLAIRDRAILLLGFAMAARRSEIAALDVTDLRFTRQGMVVTIRRSKTDQEGEGAEIAVPLVQTESVCAVRAVRKWLDASEITEGPLFRSFDLQRRCTGLPIQGQDVANLVKRVTRKANLRGDFSAHSLRAGFCTSAAESGVEMTNIARTTRHKSMAVLATYVRRADAFKDAALSAIVA